MPDAMDLSNPISEEITFFRPVCDAGCPENYVLKPEPLQVLTWKTDSGYLVSIPADYAATLDRVRAARLRKELHFFPAAAREAANQADHEALRYYLYHALPEEIVPIVNRMPCPSLVRCIFLLDESNPLDALVRLLNGDSRYCSAAQPTPNREIFFFGIFTNEWLGPFTAHPWAHLLRWDLERILTCEDTDFDIFLAQALCRCTILGRALNACLNRAELDDDTGTEHAR